MKVKIKKCLIKFFAAMLLLITFSMVSPNHSNGIPIIGADVVHADDSDSDGSNDQPTVTDVDATTVYQRYLLSSGDITLGNSQGKIIPNLGYGGVKLQFNAGKMQSSFSGSNGKKAAALFTETLNTYSEYGYTTSWSGDVMDIGYAAGRALFGAIMLLIVIVRLAFLGVMQGLIGVFKAFDLLDAASRLITNGVSNNNFILAALGIDKAMLTRIISVTFLILIVITVYTLTRALSAKGELLERRHVKPLRDRMLVLLFGTAILGALSFVTDQISGWTNDNSASTSLITASPFVSLKTWVEHSNLNPNDIGSNLTVNTSNDTFNGFSPISNDNTLPQVKKLNENIRGGSGKYNMIDQINDLLAYTGSVKYEANTYYSFLQTSSQGYGWNSVKSNWGSNEDAQRKKLLDPSKSYNVTGNENGNKSDVDGVYATILSGDSKNAMKAMTPANLWLYRYYYGSWGNPPKEYSSDKAVASNEMVRSGAKPDAAIFSNESTALMLQTKVVAPSTYVFMLNNVAPGAAQAAQQIISSDYSHYMQVSMVGRGFTKMLVYLNALVQTLFSTLLTIVVIMTILNIGLYPIAVKTPFTYFKSLMTGNLLTMGASFYYLFGFYAELWFLSFAPDWMTKAITALTSNVGKLASAATDSMLTKATGVSSGEAFQLLSFTASMAFSLLLSWLLIKDPRFQSGTSFREAVSNLIKLPWDFCYEQGQRLENMASTNGMSAEQILQRNMATTSNTMQHNIINPNGSSTKSGGTPFTSKDASNNTDGTPDVSSLSKSEQDEYRSNFGRNTDNNNLDPEFRDVKSDKETKGNTPNNSELASDNLPTGKASDNSDNAMPNTKDSHAETGKPLPASDNLPTGKASDNSDNATPNTKDGHAETGKPLPDNDNSSTGKVSDNSDNATPNTKDSHAETGKPLPDESHVSSYKSEKEAEGYYDKSEKNNNTAKPSPDNATEMSQAQRAEQKARELDRIRQENRRKKEQRAQNRSKMAKAIVFGGAGNQANRSVHDRAANTIEQNRQRRTRSSALKQIKKEDRAREMKRKNKD